MTGLIEPTIGIGGIASVVTIISSCWIMNSGIKKRHQENQQDAQEREDRLRANFVTPVEDRLKVIEVTIRDFMPRAEIAGAISHERAGRVQVQEGHQRAIEKLAADGTEIKIEIGRLRERYDGMASDIGEIKALVKEQGRDTASRLDRMGEQIGTIAHAHR